MDLTPHPSLAFGTESLPIYRRCLRLEVYPSRCSCISTGVIHAGWNVYCPRLRSAKSVETADVIQTGDFRSWEHTTTTTNIRIIVLPSHSCRTVWNSLPPVQSCVTKSVIEHVETEAVLQLA